jgi:hypothetical protein
MTRASVAAVIVSWLLAATALAAPQAPLNDNFLDSVNFNGPRTPLNSVATLEDVSDTIGAGIQSNLFDPCGAIVCAAGPAEVTTCDGVRYGKTVWYDFYPDHDGQVEIRTSGIPNVIALYTYNPHTLIPTPLQCAPGSRYPSNELFANVRRGVYYTYQVGGRNGRGGALRTLFNYVYRTRLTVAPFLTKASFLSVPGRRDEVRLVQLTFIGLSRGESVSVDCTSCAGAGFSASATKGNELVLTAHAPPIVTARTRLVIGAFSPAQIGRFKLYTVDLSQPGKPTLPVSSAGCLAPGVSSVAGAAARRSTLKRVPCQATFLNPVGGEYVFWEGIHRGLWEQWYSGLRWSAQIPLYSGPMASAPAVAVHADGEEDVFWKGATGRLWEMSWTGDWSLAVDLLGPQLGSGPSAGVDAAGDVFVFWQGTDGQLWERTFAADGSRGPAVLLASGILGSAPAVAVHANGQQDVFWKGTDGHLWSMSNAGGWHAPVNLAGGELGSGPSAGVDAAGNVYVFWQGTDQALWEKLFPAGGTPSDPIPVTTPVLGSAPSVSVHANGQQDVFFTGSNGHLWETWYTGRWNGPLDFQGGQLGSAPTAGIDAAGKQSS